MTSPPGTGTDPGWDRTPFLLLWIGQSISTFGALMTNFGIVLWMWQRTGQATPLALLELCSFGAVVVLGPLAGAICDRWGQTRTLLAGNAGAAAVLSLLLALQVTGNLSEAWIYPALLALGGALAFQYPALLASVTTLVPKSQYARAAGLLSTSMSVAGVASPAAAGWLLAHSTLSVLLALDLASYLLNMLFLLTIARLAVARRNRGTRSAPPANRRLLSDLGHGFRYVARRPDLLSLQTLFFLLYLSSMFGVLMPAMILSRSDPASGARHLATVLAAAGVGGIVGGLLTAIWGPRAHHIRLILTGILLTGLFAQIPLGLTVEPLAWAAASFLGAFLYPMIEASNQAIWQSRTPVTEQGRIFASRRVMTETAGVLVLSFAGPLADHVLEPAMRTETWLSALLAPLTGTGPGSGMAAALLLSGVFTATVAVVFVFVRQLHGLDRSPGDPGGGAAPARVRTRNDEAEPAAR